MPGGESGATQRHRPVPARRPGPGALSPVPASWRPQSWSLLSPSSGFQTHWQLLPVRAPHRCASLSSLAAPAAPVNLVATVLSRPPFCVFVAPRTAQQSRRPDPRRTPLGALGTWGRWPLRTCPVWSRPGVAALQTRTSQCFQPGAGAHPEPWLNLWCGRTPSGSCPLMLWSCQLLPPSPRRRCAQCGAAFLRRSLPGKHQPVPRAPSLLMNRQ